MSKLLKTLLSGINSALFNYQVKCGFILCVTPEGGHEEENSEEEVAVEVENEDENGEEEKNEEESATENAEEENNEESKEPDEVVVSIEGEEPAEEEATNAPQWVKDLRKSHRELVRDKRILEEKLAAVSGAKQKPEALGPKPTLEGCDFDAERFEQALDDWKERKKEAEDAEKEERERAEAANRAWQQSIDSYKQAATKLKVKDFNEAEEFVKDTLDVTQQGIIVKAALNPALVVYALGKNPKKAKELAAIKDPILYTVAIARLETQLKVTKRNSPPPPEKTVRSGGTSVSGTVDNQLERLRADAAKTGDYTKVNAYKRQLRSAGK